MRRMRVAVVLAAVVLAGSGFALEFPGKNPGSPSATEKDGSLTLSNDAIVVSWSNKGGHLAPETITNKFSSQTYSRLGKILFRIKISEGGAERVLTSADMEEVKAPAIESIKGDAKTVRAGERFDGKAITATLRDTKSGVTVEWRAEMREGGNYVRTLVKTSGGATTVDFKGLDTLAVREKKPTVFGWMSGDVIAAGQTFFATESPFALTRSSPDDFSQRLEFSLPLNKDTSYTFSTVVGAVPEGQLRRGFLYYLERERARPFRQFLHYNCWFDMGYDLSEKSLLNSIKAFTQEMTTKRGVAMDGYVIDDGWDDWNTGFWAVNKTKFPSGFDALVAEVERANSHLGIWISPLAGYAHSPERIEQARKLGLVSGKELNLSDPKYYAWFRDYCANLMTKNKMVYFKWDQAGHGVSPHFMALLRCAGELRKINPDLYVNITMGTWASPFWLTVIDCTWRDGDDVNYEGKGNDREKWITYRDAVTFKFVLGRCALYPLNSIMVHGILNAPGCNANRCFKAGNDLVHEARSYFGMGSGLQELYLMPSAMAPESWDAVASAAKWAKLNADVLVDTHWVGGDPQKLQIYGWASWTPRKGILTIRNPDDVTKEFAVDIGQAFELPAGAEKSYKMTSPYPDQKIQTVGLTAGQPHTFTLEPFDVLVLESQPTKLDEK